MIIWLTGLPCSGKSTIAHALADRLRGSGVGELETGRTVEILDGDDLRGSDFARGVGFTRELRAQHLRRVGYLATKLSHHVPYVICSFVSPHEDVRQSLVVDVMVYVECPKEVCMQRDVKGMWAKAARGEIENFTGLTGPYEPPINPDVIVHTDVQTIEECLDAIVGATRRK